MNDKVNDRGTIKWTSMMLPEHVEMLNQWYESENDVEKPILSEDQLEEMQRTILEAMEYKRKISLFFFEQRRIHLYEGYINGAGMGRLEVENEDGTDFLSIHDIVDVSIVE
ncbi:YolD-like family protein [Sediminibacillus massiliensis]|uniref:YolD-like family protein n=1 Tax=Sediminibacillus massiliensis TaxID=1926277 RepID=UPI000988581F|nr:YolD-like family protein [Sediminibacillus massiliensis]